MQSEHRLVQLRALVDRLEHLPASRQRDWMLQEARSRMVDVETGDEPRPLRTLHEEPELPPEPPEKVDNGRAVKRPRAKPARMPLQQIREVPKVSPEQAAPSPSRMADDDGSPATFGTDDLLSLEEGSGDDPAAEPGDGSSELPSWRRGLRG